MNPEPARLPGQRSCAMKPLLSAEALERYDRQIRIEEIGTSGQQKLAAARVLICGAGGLGSPAAIYLAAAGIGAITLIDSDRVARSNLNRQVLHGEADIGRFKVDSAREKLEKLAPRLELRTSTDRITDENAAEWISGHDVVIDALDNLATRTILNRAVQDPGTAFIHGAVNGFEGRVLTVLPGRSACLRCLHRGAIPDSGVFPVIGVAPAVVGALQATEAVKVLTGIGDLLTDRLIVYDGLKMTWREFKVRRNPDCAHCGRRRERKAP
jgi:adenylyltransferase/sulfurtransferase